MGISKEGWRQVVFWNICEQCGFLQLAGVISQASQVVVVVKNLPANAGDLRHTGSIPGSGRSPGGRHGTPLQYSQPGESHGQRSLVSYGP